MSIEEGGHSFCKMTNKCIQFIIWSKVVPAHNFFKLISLQYSFTERPDNSTAGWGLHINKMIIPFK